MASSEFDRDDNILQCRICSNNMQDPRLLPCLHRFCVKCIQKIIDSCDGKMTCPTCELPIEVPKEGASGYMSDFVSISILLDTKQKEKELVGSSGCCEEESEIAAFCSTCDSFICHNCRKMHLKLIQLLKTHTQILNLDVSNLDQLQSSVMRVQGKEHNCRTHANQTIVIACKTCDNELICSKCLPHHSNHAFEDIKETAKKITQEINEQLLQAKQSKKRWDVYQMQIKEGQQNTQNETKVAEERIEVIAKKKLVEIDVEREKSIKTVTEKRDSNIQKLKQAIEAELQLKKDEIKSAEEVSCKKKKEIEIAKQNLNETLCRDSAKFEQQYLQMKKKVNRLIDRYVNCLISASYTLSGNECETVNRSHIIKGALEQLNKDLEEDFQAVEEARQHRVEFFASEKNDEVGFFFGVPEKPSKPTVVMFNEKEITIEWTPPALNGRAAITGYAIQRFKSNGVWEDAQQYVPGTRYGIGELTVHTDYQFRVAAQNRAGTGAYSEPSRVVHHPCSDESLILGARVQIRAKRECGAFQPNHDWRDYESMQLHSPGTGTVSRRCDDGLVYVKWDTSESSFRHYCMGKAGQYRLKLSQ